MLRTLVRVLRTHGGKPMASLKKCANPACNCVPPNKEKYCSAHCEGIADKTEIVCTCGHEGCTHAGMRA